MPVFVVPVRDCWLVHAPLAGISALVNTSGVTAPGLIPDLDQQRESPPGPRTGPIAPVFLGLLPTRACNMACVYCGFGAPGAPQSRMREETAVAAIDWAARTAADRGAGSLAVHLFGGEPLLAKDLVEIIVHRTRAKASEYHLVPGLETATNATCDEPFARFVGDHFSAVIVSLDGFGEVQNRHRPLKGGLPSFDAVCRTAHIWSQSPVKLCLRICVTADNVDQFAQAAEWFAEEFEPAVIDCETIEPSPESRRAGLERPDPLVFAREFWRARQLCAQAGVDVSYGASVTEHPRATLCPVGQDAVIVSPDGRISSCYLEQRDWQARGMDLDFGAVAESAVRLDLTALQRIRNLANPHGRCEKCFCRWSCAGGCHVTHSDLCRQTRLITAAELLAGMGEPGHAADLLYDTPAAMRLACGVDDTIEDWRLCHV